MIVMFVYSTSETENRKEVGQEKINKTELQYKWLLFQRFFNKKAAHVGGSLTGPVIEILIKHFYDIEIGKQYRFDRIALVDSVRKNLFEDFMFNNLAD